MSRVRPKWLYIPPKSKLSLMELWEKKNVIIKWLKAPAAERGISRRGLAQRLGVGLAYIDEIEAELHPFGQVAEDMSEQLYDSDKWLQKRTPEMDKALVTACEKGSPAALQLFYKLNKRLIEQSETKVKFSLDADELARIRSEARRELEAEGFLPQGNREVRPESPILLKEIREGEGQTQGSNSV
jgi:hypothetical protein